jgi:hypothetical protein
LGNLDDDRRINRVWENIGLKRDIQNSLNQRKQTKSQGCRILTKWRKSEPYMI